MFTLMSRTLVRAVILSSVLLAGTSAALAQVPTSTPRPSPAPGDPTRPPGQDPVPGTTPATNPQAPPGTQQAPPTAPPGTVQPAQTPAPTPPTGEATGPVREPVIPAFQPRPLPPVPSLQRLGVGTETLAISLNDAIKRALENNNDIEVARDDVRFAETQLRALEGIFDPIFSINPRYDKRISPQQSSLGGGTDTGTTSTTTY